MVWPAIIAAGAKVGGDLISNAQAKKESKKNRKFQERMSNTAYQRGVKDLKAAGLNPMLAYQQGGASTPQGGQADLQPIDLGGAATTAIQVQNTKANTELQRAQTRTENERGNIAAIDALKAQSDYDLDLKDGGPSVFQEEQMGRRAKAQQQISEARIKNIESQILERTANTAIERANLERDLTKEKVNFEKAHAILTEAGIAEAKAMEKWFDTVGAASPAAKAGMTVIQWIRFILGGATK